MEYFSNFNSKDAQSITFEQLADLIRSDEQLKKSTLLYRDLLAQGHDKAANDVKKATPQVAVSFRMEGGKGKDNCRECHYQMLIDFDAKSPKERLPNDELERVKTFLRTSYHARFGYESISGLGYHIVVPFILPDGITIDMTDDPKLAEEIYTRVYRRIANQFTVWCGHPMDKECKNINRLMGLCHDPLAVYRPDARPFRLTREELGIDADGMFAQAIYLLKDGFNYWFDLDEINTLKEHVETFMITPNEEELIPIYFSPAKLEDAGSTFLTLAEISAKIVAFGNLKKTPDPRRLGTIMTKLGFEKSRNGHNSTRGYYVREHTQSDIERLRHPEVF